MISPTRHLLRRRPWWPICILLLAVATTAFADEDLERNRTLLERWRADPEHYQRLQRDLRAFYRLPAWKQEQMRLLDRRLHEADLTTQTRLWGVLERYANWLEHLSEQDRQRVRLAPDGKTRLQRIREIRDRQWVDRLPSKVREGVHDLPVEERASRIARLRAEERRQMGLTEATPPAKGDPNPRPSKLSEFPPETQGFLERLMPRLNAEERQRLQLAEGKWPDLPRVVRELADVHPILPPLPKFGPITVPAEIPKEVKKALGTGKGKLKQAHRSLGRWPDYALDLVRLAQREKIVIAPLGASRPGEFPPEVQAFLKDRLFPQLPGPQKDALERLEGRWPEYPLQLLRLARDRRLVIPGMSLPGPPELWDNAWMGMPNVPDHLLMQFALHETSPEDRANWELDTTDPMGSRERVKKAYYRNKLDEQNRLKRKNGASLEPTR